MLTRSLRSRACGDAVLCLFLLVGCPNGDFGRVRPGLVTDEIHAWVGRDAARAVGAPISLYPLTDDELLLRDYAYQLIEPAYDRQRWYSVIGEWGLTGYFRPEWWRCDPTAYAAWLMNAYVRSEIALYARLNDDIRNDVLRIEQLVPVARRVLDMDRKREQSLAYIAVLSGPEIANARARIGENILVVGWVQQSVAERIAGGFSRRCERELRGIGEHRRRSAALPGMPRHGQSATGTQTTCCSYRSIRSTPLPPPVAR